MRLYLVRHGEARSKSVDPERRLSDEGRRDVERVAGLLGPLGLSVSAIGHSGKARARETADILAGALDVEGGVTERPGLAPDDDVRPIAEEVGRAGEDIMLVGHLPFMGRLASLLVAGSESADVVAFRECAVVCLERGRQAVSIEDRTSSRGHAGGWTILWAASPELVP